MRSTIFGLAALITLSTSACGQVDQAMQEQTRQTANLTAEAQRQVGMPGITNFTERRLLRQLFELRDQEISTYTYIVDWQGRLFHLCDSIGFGMPFSAQYSNPESPVVLDPYGSGGTKNVYQLPQPEPNGLYPPTSTTATWVICAASGGEFRPVYVEPLIMVSTFPLTGIVRSYTQD